MTSRRLARTVTALGTVALLALTGCAATNADTEPAASVQTRTVEHYFGETEIGSTARVAVLDGDRTLEAVVALGVQPVAAVKPPLTGDYSSVVRERLDKEPTDIGAAEGEVNYEALLASEPDLIIMNAQAESDREVYDQASAIAPTIAIEYTAAGWKDVLTKLGHVFDRSDAAADLIAAYDEKAATTRDALDVAGTTTSVVRVRADSVRYMTQEGSFPWTVLKDLGYTAPKAQELGDDEVQTVTVSLENIDILAADRIVLLTDAGTEDAAATLLDGPVFANAHVKSLPSSEFLFGNVLTAQHMLDELASL
ncbi:iron complex transport system substrate-binding protein [Agreia bicolorata]|uniref:Iron complex transport system substrate-binding protein n=1 Tax=Agreia bicolorata TaxID=110935 RepID=A0A1T4Y9G0_9MICO|nr:ABC transporter substrate-binding protein [Agreia bicolorata]SKA98442.1 iron complex transport system substrate-binding protein [Agreia bicolorata]